MNKPKQVNITRRLIFGFCGLISIFLLFGMFTLYDIHRISDLSRTIYNHPLVVSNAALQSNVSITKMHRNMKDGVFSNSLLKVQKFIEAMNEEEKQVYTHLDIVKNRIIGEEGKVLEIEARNFFDAWRPIRKEVIGLVTGDQREKAVKITTGKGANHVALLEEKMLRLTKYAREKASDFMHESERVHSRLNMISIFLLLFGIFTSFLVAFFTIKYTSSAEKELQESENNLRDLMENVPAGVTVSSPEGVVYEANLTVLKLFGYDSKEDFFKTPAPSHYYDKKERERFVELHKKGLSKDFESQFIRKDGTVFWGTVTSLSQITATGATRDLNVFQDITKRKQAEKALQKSKDEMRAILDAVAETIVLIDRQGMVIMANQIVCERLGIKEEDFIGHCIYDFFTPEVAEKRRREWEVVFETGKPVSFEDNREGMFFEQKAYPVLSNGDRVEKVVSFARDISERKHAEEALRESEKKYRTLLETTSEGCTILNPELKIIEVNEAFCTMLGYSQDEIIGKTPFDFVDDENRKIFVEQTSKIPSTPHRSYEITLKKKNGKDLPTYFNATTIRDESGVVQGSFALITDVTEKKQIEEERNRLAVCIEQSVESVFITDRDGRIQYINPAFERVTGYSREETIGQTPRILKSGKHDALFYKQMWHTLTSGNTWHGRITNRKKDGSFYETEATISPISDKSGRIANFVSIKRDITDQIALEAQLQRAQKMEAIGALAGGVAHDLNNVLSGIVSYPELLLLDLPEDSPLRKPILTIQKSGKKAADIVQDLLTLARRGVVATEVVNLNQIINSYLKSPECKNLKGFYPDAKIESNLEAYLLNIMGSSVHLSKTVMNLVSNAAEAMPEGGDIFISTESKYIDKPIKGYDDVKEGDYVILTVSDTGIGISSEDLERIFEPFYTKKIMGRSGTGLGMAVVWGTVKDHKGYIDVQSTEGKGTTFTLYFPVSRKEITGKEEALPMEEYMGKGETVLVVDDVEEQREMASRILNKLGYSVTSVSSGEEAVDYMRDNSADLLVLDMIMDPGIDGLETYKRILELHPGQKAIIASGFAETDRVKKAQRLGAGEYIKKPYTLGKIGMAVRDELDK